MGIDYRRTFVDWLAATVHRTCGRDARARAFELALVSQGGGSRPKPSKRRAHWAEITGPALRGTVSGVSLRWRGPAVTSAASSGRWPMVRWRHSMIARDRARSRSYIRCARELVRKKMQLKPRVA